MERKIDLLLRVVADMKRFENGGQEACAQDDCDELSADELELVSAARGDTLLPEWDSAQERSD